MVTGEFNAEVLPCNGLASHPGRSRNTSSRFMLKETGEKRHPDEPLGSYVDFSFTNRGALVLENSSF